MTKQRERLCAILALLGLLTTAYAQPVSPGFPPGKWWKHRGLVDELKLTPEQQARIESVWMENRKPLIDQKADLDKRRIDLSDLLSKGSVDESAALKAFDQLQAARATLERTTFAMQVRIKNLLSPEQQQKIEEVAARIRQERATARNKPPIIAPGTPR